MKNKTKKYNGGELNFGVEILIFIVIVFILWVLAGGTKKEQQTSPLLVPEVSNVNTNNGYGPTNA